METRKTLIAGAIAYIAALSPLYGCGSSDSGTEEAKVPSLLAGGLRTENTGNGTYVSASSPNITSATGSFPCAFVSAGESSNGVPNAYSLQLNVPALNVPQCSGRPPGCIGTIQFAFQSDNSLVFIQYILSNYGRPCPPNWMALSDGTTCQINSQSKQAPLQTAQSLGQLALTGSVGGGLNQASLSVAGGPPITVTNSDIFQLQGNWATAEFNVYGPRNGQQATFVPLTTLAARLQVNDGTSFAPTCGPFGNSTETTNLNIDTQIGQNGCQPWSGPVPEIDFVETTFACQPGMCGDNFLGCGKTMNCGGCPSGQYCVNNACSACRGTCPAGFHPCNTDPCDPQCQRGLCQ
jgi:hypothetical protein